MAEGKCCPLCPCPCNDPSRAGHHGPTANRRAASPSRQRPEQVQSNYSSSGSESVRSWTHVPSGQGRPSQRQTNQSNTRQYGSSSSSMNSGVKQTLQINEILLLKRKLQVLETRLQVLEAQLATLMERHRRLNLLRGNVVTAVNHEFDQFGPVQ